MKCAFILWRCSCAVLLLRLERETGRDKVAVLNQILAGFADDLVGGYAAYQRGPLRIR